MKFPLYAERRLYDAILKNLDRAHRIASDATGLSISLDDKLRFTRLSEAIKIARTSLRKHYYEFEDAFATLRKNDPGDSD